MNKDKEFQKTKLGLWKETDIYKELLEEAKDLNKNKEFWKEVSNIENSIALSSKKLKLSKVSKKRWDIFYHRIENKWESFCNKWNISYEVFRAKNKIEIKPPAEFPIEFNAKNGRWYRSMRLTRVVSKKEYEELGSLYLIAQSECYPDDLPSGGRKTDKKLGVVYGQLAVKYNKLLSKGKKWRAILSIFKSQEGKSINTLRNEVLPRAKQLRQK
jgi:hypothetical protein